MFAALGRSAPSLGSRLGASRPLKKTNLVLITLAVGGALLLSGCTAPDNGDDGQVLVEMKAPVKFEPETITIERGTEVVWINRDSTGHNVVSDDGSFDGMDPNKLLRGGQQFSFTFDEPGIYPYHCEPHAAPSGDGSYNGMIGTVIVLNEDGSTPTPDEPAAGDDNTTGNETA